MIGMGILVVAGLATALSKELIRARGRHVFNPSNFGLVFVLPFFGGLAGPGSSSVYNARRFHGVVAFYVTYVTWPSPRWPWLWRVDDRVFNASVLLFRLLRKTLLRPRMDHRQGRSFLGFATSCLSAIGRETVTRPHRPGCQLGSDSARWPRPTCCAL